MKIDILTLGDLVADIVVPIPHLPIRAGEHQPAHEMMIEAGGAGNFLILAARLGLKSKALGTVGEDYYGEVVLKMLAAEGVAVDSVIIPPGSRTTVALVLVDDAGDHVFVGKNGDGPQPPYHPQWGDFIRQAGAIFTAGYALHPTSTFAPETMMTCLQVAHQQRVPVFFDLGPPEFWAGHDDIKAAIDYTTIFLATAEEASTWTGIDDPLAAAHALLTPTLTMVIIKLGADGCLLATAERHVHVPGFPVNVRDTAGAGDAFAAGCVYGYLQDWPLEHIGLLANAVGGAAVTKLGTGASLPQRREVVELLRRHGHSILS
jgi:sugar/nucleoside kinase (ribokinase family)